MNKKKETNPAKLPKRIGNRKVRTAKQVDSFNGYYSVGRLNRERMGIRFSGARKISSLHPIGKTFSLFNNHRKKRIQIDSETSIRWRDKFKDNYTLFEVQNAVNKCILTYQEVNAENVEKMLKH